jgi:O-antigen/teichoic acid export membrane protein/peptidoglycan/xylan/chitin deacetylase (PgdA/CDA1 family)
MSKYIPVLMYHNIVEQNFSNAPDWISPNLFREQMLYIKKKGYTSISPDLLLTPELLPKKPILITFDDGYENVNHLAFPILKELNIKATLFLITSCLGNQNIKYNNDWNEGDRPLAYHLTVEMVKEMLDSKLISIGCHSNSHKTFKNLSEAEIENEVSISKRILKDKLNLVTPVFAYPGGFVGDENKTYKILSENKIQLAFGAQTDNIENISKIDYLNIQRISITRENNFTNNTAKFRFEALVNPYIHKISKYNSLNKLVNILLAFIAIKISDDNYKENSVNYIKTTKKEDFLKESDLLIDVIEKKAKNKFKIKSFLTEGHERSVKTKKNIFTSIIIKCISISISFILIPLTLNYLNPVNYGIWLTLTSVIGWFAFFDLGLGNGLRNKLAEALAKNNKELARTYISTSYAIISLTIGIVYLIFILVFSFINWSFILNTPPSMNDEINRLIFIVFSFFCLQFIIKLISMILIADQRTAISSGINTFASLLSLIIVFVLTKTTQGSLLWLSIGICAANLISPLIATLWYFGKDYKHLTPSIKYVKLSCAKDLMGLGFLFFIMQFAALILFSTDSIIIDQLYGPQEVTPYNIAFKYFSIINMGFAIVTAPFWTAYTDAYHKQDFDWIKRTTKKLTMFWLLLVVGVTGMLIFADNFYEIWIGNQIKIPFILSLAMAFWVLIATWTSMFGNFLSGVGKVRLSLYHSFAMIVINIPLSIFLAKYLNLGSAGVIIGTCICVLPQVFLHPIQYKKIISNTANGIWGK